MRKWRYRFPPSVPPPAGHQHRLRVRGSVKVGPHASLPRLECRCGLVLVPEGRPRSSGYAIAHLGPDPPEEPIGATYADTGFLDEGRPLARKPRCEADREDP